MVERQSKCNIMIVRSDNAGEILKVLKNWKMNNGVVSQTTAPYSSHQNVVAERAIQSTVYATRALLKEAKLPVEFWADAARTHTYINDRIKSGPAVTKYSEGQEISKQVSPEEAWTGDPVSIRHFKVFGCKAFSHNDRKSHLKGSRKDRLVESIVFFDAREKFYNPENYNIGPYKNTKEYIITCYDREIFYWTHNSKDDTEAQLPPLFEENMVINLVEKMKRERQALIDGKHEASLNIMDAEPRVLVHEDLSGSNILVHNGHLAAILDWEFSGIYSLSVMRAPRQVLRISGACFNLDEEIEDEESRLNKRVGEDAL